MIQWKFVAPRLVIVACLLLFLALAIDPLARRSLIEIGQRTTGGSVTIDHVETSLAHAQFGLSGLAVGQAQTPGENLVSAQAALVDLDAAALCGRRLVVETGVIQGLVIRVPISTTSKPECEDGSGWQLPQLSAANEQRLLAAAKMLGENLTEHLESVQLARQLAARWPEEYRDLEQRIDRWLRDVAELEKLPELLGRDPLGDAQCVERAALTLQSLKEELQALRADFQRLQQQAKLDRSQLTVAVERDVANIEERLKLGAFDPHTLSEELLGPEIAPHVTSAIGWVTWAREHLPDDDFAQPARARGVDVSFATADDEPWFVARSLQLSGEIVQGDRRVPYLALVSGLSSSPRRYSQPATLRMKLQEPAETWIELTVDRRQGVRRERLVLICPQLSLPQQTWGDAEKLVLAVSPGPLAMQCVLSLDGDALAGEVLVRRSDLSLDLQLGDAWGGPALAERVARSLRDIRQVDIHIGLGGTLTRPAVQLHSPLGQQLATAMSSSLTEELSLRRDELRAQARTAIDGEINDFTAQLDKQKQLVLNKLGFADDRQKQLEALIAQSFGLSKQRVGQQLLRALDR